MAFPTTSILDNFNRTDASSLGANWSRGRDFSSPSDTPHIISNQVGYESGDNGYCYWYYNVATYGPNSECYISTPVMSSSCDAVLVCCRVADPGSSWDGYFVYIDPTLENNNTQISRIDNGTPTQLGATITQTVDSGDGLGIEAIGSTIKGYFNDDGGGWTEIGSRSDSTYSSAGYVQIYLGSNDATVRWDNFGGGTVAGSSASPSASPSGSPSSSPSRSPSVSPSASISPSISPSVSPSASLSVSPSRSPSASPSVSPSASISPSISPSRSPSASPSVSPSASISPSVSPSTSPSLGSSPSPSASPSRSPSASPSVSPSASISPSVSPSVSPSASISPSASVSPSVSPSSGITSNSVCWGHVTDVEETTVRNFSGNWTGTGSVTGSGDSEEIELNGGEYMESEFINTGAILIGLQQNKYVSGDTVTLKYRTGATQVACEGASWTTYSTTFMSSGFVQIRVEV